MARGRAVWQAAAFRKTVVAALVLAAPPALTGFPGAAAQEWKPDKPVELVATNAPGGGSDRIGRILIKIIQERRYVPVQMNVVNKPGGGSSVAYNYINQYPGNGHFMVMGSRSFITNNIAGHGPAYTEFTPVVSMFDEYIAVTVKPVSPIKSGKDLISFMKRDPTTISFGIATSLGAPNHSGVAAAFKVAGIDLKKTKNVIFPSGGAASTALMGGHIDVVPISVAFAASLLRNGQVRLIAITAPERLGGVLKDVPTWKEQGFDAVVSQWRVLIGPKGMTEGQVAFWENAIRRTMEADEWKAELETNFWRPNPRGGAETRKFLARDYEDAKVFLTELGLAK
ncbi:MAG TPA: tripartite tricarboxylate transporter substrate binding protein [Burkholderiales bacterium]|nr:tripartite tricarboxylate transporter substrate binding protein [Burkholderiales bacterium]